MEDLTWQLVVVIIGGLTSLLAFLYAMLTKNKKDSSDKSDNSIFPWTIDTERNRSNIEKNNAVIEEQIISLRKDVADLKKHVDTGDTKTRETFEKFEAKIEKLTNVIIDHMHNENNNNSK